MESGEYYDTPVALSFFDLSTLSPQFTCGPVGKICYCSVCQKNTATLKPFLPG